MTKVFMPCEGAWLIASLKGLLICLLLAFLVEERYKKCQRCLETTLVYGVKKTCKKDDQAMGRYPSRCEGDNNLSTIYDSRILPLKAVTNDLITTVTPPSGKIAPPGYYMLFVNYCGVPSKDVLVHVD